MTVPGDSVEHGRRALKLSGSGEWTRGCLGKRHAQTMKEISMKKMRRLTEQIKQTAKTSLKKKAEDSKPKKTGTVVTT